MDNIIAHLMGMSLDIDNYPQKFNNDNNNNN